jgi:hypothetical protein
VHHGKEDHQTADEHSKEALECSIGLTNGQRKL